MFQLYEFVLAPFHLKAEDFVNEIENRHWKSVGDQSSRAVHDGNLSVYFATGGFSTTRHKYYRVRTIGQGCTLWEHRYGMNPLITREVQNVVMQCKFEPLPADSPLYPHACKCKLFYAISGNYKFEINVAWTSRVAGLVQQVFDEMVAIGLVSLQSTVQLTFVETEVKGQKPSKCQLIKNCTLVREDFAQNGGDLSMLDKVKLGQNPQNKGANKGKAKLGKNKGTDIGKVIKKPAAAQRRSSAAV